MRALSTSGLLFIAVMFLSCSDDGTQTPGTAPLEETTWRLVGFELTGGSIPAAEGQELTLRLGAKAGGAGIASAVADCNQCGGPYILGPDNSISIELVCTEIYCGDDSQGGLFELALNHALTYSQNDGSLRLDFSNGGEEGSIVFTAETE